MLPWGVIGWRETSSKISSAVAASSTSNPITCLSTFSLGPGRRNSFPSSLVRTVASPGGVIATAQHADPTLFGFRQPPSRLGVQPLRTLRRLEGRAGTDYHQEAHVQLSTRHTDWLHSAGDPGAVVVTHRLVVFGV